MARTPISILAADRRGAAAIEYAIILPVLLLFMLGVMDTGRLLWSYTTLYRATEAAARCAAINTTACGSTGQIQAQASAAAWGMTIAPGAFSVANPACGVQVNGSYDFIYTMPGFSTLTLTASSCHPK